MSTGWTETSPGVFESELGGVERIYRAASQAFKSLHIEHWGLYAACTLDLTRWSRGRDGELASAVRRAWIALRHQYPGLAVVATGLGGKRYSLPDAASVDDWATETFFVSGADADEILASYPLRDWPSLYFFPAASTVLLLVSHWRVDGIGACVLLDRLIELVVSSSPEISSWRPDLRKLSPGVQEAMGAPDIPVTPQLEATCRSKIAQHHQIAVNAAGLPFEGDKTTPPGHAMRVATTLDEAKTARLVAWCKARHITVTSAVHAALAEVVLDRSPDQPAMYAAVVSANLRKHMMPPYNSRDHACSVYVTGITPSVDRDTSFDDKAQQLTAYYKGWYSDEFVKTYRLMTQYHAEAMSSPRPPRVKPPSAVTLSSLGVIENHLASQHGAVTVSDFRFGVSMMTRQMLLYVWTFRGCLTFSVNFNGAYHGADSVTDFIQAIIGVLDQHVDG